MKWKLPVVSKDWVQACFRVPEKNFLMGESKNFTEGKPEPSELEKEGKERGWDGKVLFHQSSSFSPPFQEYSSTSPYSISSSSSSSSPYCASLNYSIFLFILI